MPTFWYMRSCSKLVAGARVAALAPLFLLLFAQRIEAATAAPAPAFHPSLKAAAEAALADQGLVLIVFEAEWCAPCRQFKAKTLSSKEFMEQGGAVHMAEIDVDAERTAARDYSVEAVPTLVLMTPDSKIVARSEGFMETAALMLWLREARERVKEGKWEGTAPGSKLKEFVARAAADQLDTNDLARLVGMLGEPNPADRETAAKLLLDQRDQAVAPLIDALTNGYLGIRIAANDTLHRLAPDAAPIDPWQSPGELAQAVTGLKEWWAATGKLPSQQATPKLDPATATSIRAALENLRGTDPVKSTEAMSTLVGLGGAALTPVREAIKATEKAGDQRSLALLDDVRWAILIPESVDQRAGGARGVLARGKGPERQAAAGRLGRAGRAAIPALAELVDDADPLVVESAVRALSSIGGKDAIPAIAALLKAGDSNLRMTAAQALGHTKNTAAVKEVLTVIDDPNEVVACSALSALDEINSDRIYSPSKKPQPPEVIQALKSCLADPRWRVRAAAAEVTGKLGANELIPQLNTLLSDPDGFVVKNALEGLQKMSAAPDPQKLLAVAGAHPDLKGQAVEILVKWGTEDAVKAVTGLYRSNGAEGRIAIVKSLGTAPQQNQEPSPWQPLLAQASTESDPRLRRAAAQILAAQPPVLAAALVGPFLSDEDEEARRAGAGAVLSVIGRERQIVTGSHGSSTFEFFSPNEIEDVFNASRKKTTVTNPPPATAEQIAAWHAALQQKAGKNPDLLTATATYVTGSSTADLAALEAAAQVADKASLDALSHSAAVAALVPRLLWPDGKPVVERLCLSPLLFLKMTVYAHQAPAGLGEFLFQPERFRAAVDRVSPDDLESVLQRLLGSRQQAWSLLSSNPRTDGVVYALLDATNAVWRAVAIYSLGLRDDPKAQGCLERALNDSNSWVRAAAVSGVARAVKDRPARERLLGPLLADENRKVAQLVTIGLLEPETRSAAGLDYASGYFEFEKLRIWSVSYEPGGEQRPLAVLQGNPAFLETARQKLASASFEEAALPALLLAQYGDFSGLDRVLGTITAEKQTDSEAIVLAAIGLSRDTKYVPHLKKVLASFREEQDFRRLLQTLRGMSGAEAREMRLEINKRMRQGRE